MSLWTERILNHFTADHHAAVDGVRPRLPRMRCYALYIVRRPHPPSPPSPPPTLPAIQGRNIAPNLTEPIHQLRRDSHYAQLSVPYPDAPDQLLVPSRHAKERMLRIERSFAHMQADLCIQSSLCPVAAAQAQRERLGRLNLVIERIFLVMLANRDCRARLQWMDPPHPRSVTVPLIPVQPLRVIALARVLRSMIARQRQHLAYAQPVKEPMSGLGQALRVLLSTNRTVRF